MLSQHCGTVRIVGIAKGFDSSLQELILHYKGFTARVDVSLIRPFYYKEGETYQFIGDIEGTQVKAYLHRVMDGLDIELYHKAQGMRTNEHKL